MGALGGAWRHFEKEDDASLDQQLAEFKRMVFETRPESRADPSGYQAYAKACREEGLVVLTAMEGKLAREKLSLARADLGPAGMRALSAALLANAAVTELDVEENGLLAAGALALARVLQARRPAPAPAAPRRSRSEPRRPQGSARIRVLHVGRNRLGKQGGLALAGGLRASAALARLECASNGLEDQAAAALFAGLEGNGTLTRLDLSDNVIGDGAAKALAALLARNACLRDLDLSSNRFTSHAAQVIAKALEGNVALGRLDLSGSELAVDGSLAFGAAIARNATLGELVLSNTGVPLEGAIALAYALRSNRALRRLDLSSNPLTKEGRRALLTAHLRSGSQCSLGLERTDATVGRNKIVFDPERLTGLYRLRLDDPWERWVAHRLRERACTHKGETWRHATLNRRRYQLPALAEELPPAGVLEVDYIATVGAPIYKRRIKLDLSLPEGHGVALQLMERCLEHMEESWHDSYLSGKPFIISKQRGALKVPERGVLELNYLIHSEHAGLRFNREEPAGHYRLRLALPWERWVADQLRTRALTEPGEAWLNEHFNEKPFRFKSSWQLPDWGVLELDFATSQQAATLAVPYALDMARPWSQWIARRLIDRVRALHGGERWDDVTLDSEPQELHDPKHPWAIPTRGTLRLRHLVLDPERVRKERRRFNLTSPSEAAELEALVALAEASSDCTFQHVSVGREPFPPSQDPAGVSSELRGLLEAKREARERRAVEDRLLEQEASADERRLDLKTFDADWVFLDPPELGPARDAEEHALLLARLCQAEDDHEAMGIVRAACVDAFSAAQVREILLVPPLKSKVAALGAMLPRTRDMHTLLHSAQAFPFPCDAAPVARATLNKAWVPPAPAAPAPPGPASSPRKSPRKLSASAAAAAAARPPSAPHALAVAAGTPRRTPASPAHAFSCSPPDCPP
eukprot:tig00020603_g11767.t1